MDLGRKYTSAPPQLESQKEDALHCAEEESSLGRTRCFGGNSLKRNIEKTLPGMTVDRQSTITLSLTQTVNIPNIKVRHQKLGGESILPPPSFWANLRMDSHVQYMLSQCAQRMYLIKLLQHKGMPQRQLSGVSYSIVVSRILYALPAWGGFLSAELIGRINAFFRRVKRFGYIDTVFTVDELLSQSEYDLFVKPSTPGHSTSFASPIS